MEIKSKTLEYLISIEFTEELGNDIGKAALQLIDQEFNGSYSPYKAAWEPLKYRVGKPLIKTGALKAGFSFTVSGNEIIVKNDVPYAVYHDLGTEKIPKREILPDKVLPRSWYEEFSRICDELAKKGNK